MDNITDWVTIVVMVLGFIGQAFYLKGSLEEKLKNLASAVNELKQNVRYEDTCDKTVAGLDRRISCLENVRNGKS